MSDSDARIWDDPALIGQGHLKRVVERCAGQSFLVTAEFVDDAQQAAWLLACSWSGHAGEPKPADVVCYRQPVMDTIREELIPQAHLAPLAGDRKAIVLALSEEPRPEHVNILLKLTEEPPAHLGLFLAAAGRTRLPSTLRSRLFQLPLRPVAGDRLARWLRECHRVPPEAADRAANEAEGWPLRALALANAEGPRHWPVLKEALQRGGVAGLAAAASLADGVTNLLDALEREFAAEEATERAFYRRARWHLARARHHLVRNANRRLVLDNLLSHLAVDLAKQARREPLPVSWPTW